MISENLNQKEELESIVKEWLSIDDEISKLNFALKERKKKKEELTTYIMGFMKNNEIPFFNINNGKLIMTESKQKKPLNKESMLKLTTSFFSNNVEQANNLINFINQNRESFVRNRLKRSKK